MVGFLDELATNMVEERKGRRKKKNSWWVIREISLALIPC
jgi:hypothetical protein